MSRGRSHSPITGQALPQKKGPFCDAINGPHEACLPLTVRWNVVKGLKQRLEEQGWRGSGNVKTGKDVRKKRKKCLERETGRKTHISWFECGREKKINC